MIGYRRTEGLIGEVRWAPDEMGDASESHRQTWSLTIQGGQAPMVRHGSEYMRSVRVMKNGRLGMATSRLDGWDDLQREARDALRHGVEVAMDVSDILGGRTMPIVSRWDPDWLSSIDATVRAVYEGLKGLSPDFRPVVTVTYHEDTVEMVTSRNGRTAWMRGYWELTAGGRQVDGTDFHGVSGARLSGHGIPDGQKLLDELQARFHWGRSHYVIQSGRYPVVFLPPVAMGLLNPVLARLSGPALVAGNSPWEDQQGLQVLSTAISVVSDATLPEGPRSGPFDDEGTPTATHTLIDKGVLKHFILDRDASRRLGHEPKGMGYRGTLNGPIQAAPANVTVTPGPSTWSELLRRFPGVLILNGWIGGRPTNPMRGDIAGNASDLYWVEKGEVMGRVKNAVVSVNAFDALREQLIDVGNDPQWIAQGMMQIAPGKVPPVLIDQVDVAVKQ